MEKTELRIQEHSIVPGAKVIEVWYKGNLIGTVAGADGPGVRIISKFPLEAVAIAPSGINVATVKIMSERKLQT